MNLSIDKIFKIITAAWIALAIFFMVRGLMLEKDKSTLRDYVSLARADWEGKRVIILGNDLYEFARFCKAELFAGAGYEVVGIPEDSIDLPRLVYYLYPAIKTEDPNFILVYKKPDFVKNGTQLYMSLNKESFILRRE
ncbi:MAG: hypothetical protein WC317_07535 [Candidatus Omnitrophota bacterium]|jgi:hypothetical protein